MAVKMVCDFCDKPLELEDGRYVIYHTKQLNTRKIFKHLCKNCADKLDMVIKLTEDATRERCQDFGHWKKINKARREQLGTKG